MKDSTDIHMAMSTVAARRTKYYGGVTKIGVGGGGVKGYLQQNLAGKNAEKNLL